MRKIINLEVSSDHFRNHCEIDINLLLQMKTEPEGRLETYTGFYR